MTDFKDMVDATKQVLEVIPKAYDDGLQPTIQEAGKLLSLPFKAVNAALSPIACWIEKRNFAVEETKKLLAKKLESVDPSNIVPPDPYVAVPAIEAISYSMESEDLRNLYANLLAKSVQQGIKDTVHPSFVEIIKQLSPFEAKLISELYSDFNLNNDELPLIQLFASTHTKEEIQNLLSKIPLSDINKSNVDSIIVIQNILNPKYYNSLNLNIVSSSLDNLERLKLINIFYNNSIVNKDLYNELTTAPRVLEYVSKIKNNEIYNNHINEDFVQGYISPSSFGKSFINTCVLE